MTNFDCQDITFDQYVDHIFHETLSDIVVGISQHDQDNHRLQVINCLKNLGVEEEIEWEVKLPQITEDKEQPQIEEKQQTEIQDKQNQENENQDQ